MIMAKITLKGDDFFALKIAIMLDDGGKKSI